MLTVVPNCWDHTSPHKAVFPNVFKFVSSTEGLAASCFPSLLPFLGKLPLEVIGEQEKFFGRWFGAFEEQLEKLRGASELAAVVGAYLECLVYILGREGVEEEVRGGLLTSRLVPLVLRGLGEPRLGESGLLEQLGPFLQAWGSKEGLSGICRSFWEAIEEEVVARVGGKEEEEVERVIVRLSKLGKQTAGLPGLNSLVTRLWQHQVTQLRAGEMVGVSCSRLSLLLRHLVPDHLRAKLLPQGEQMFLQELLLPLLQDQDHRRAACGLLWQVARSLPEASLASLLASLTFVQPEATAPLLEAAGREARSSQGVAMWLQSGKVVEQALKLVDRSLKGGKEEAARSLATLKAFKDAGLAFTEDGHRQRLVASLLACLPQQAPPQQLEAVCNVLQAVEAPGLWASPCCQPLLLQLYSLDCGVLHPQLERKVEQCWVRGVGPGLEDRVAQVVRKQLEEGRGDEVTGGTDRLLAKCVLVVQHLEEQAQDSFLLATVPATESLAPLGQEARHRVVVTQEQYSTSCPLAASFPAPTSCLARPRASQFMLRLLHHRLALPLPGEDPDLATVPDTARHTLGEEYTPLLAEALLATVATQELAARVACPEVLASLASSLATTTTSLLAHLSKESSLRLQHRLRTSSLSEGGLWSAALALLLRVQYRSSEWEVGLASLLPRPHQWGEGELATAGTVLALAQELATSGGLISSTLCTEVARLVSLGGLGQATAPLAWLVGHCLALASPAQARDSEQELASALASLPAWRQGQEEELLYSRDLASASWQECAAVAAVAHLLAKVVERCPAALSPELWDLASCSLVSWAASLEETGPALLLLPGPATLCVAVARLGATLGARLGPPGHHSALSPPAQQEEHELPPKLREEWAEFFSESVFSSLLRVHVSLSSLPDPGQVRPLIQQELGAALVHCPAPLLASSCLPALHLPQDVDCPSPLPDILTYLLNHLGPLLLAPCRHTQVTTAHLLAAAAPQLVAAEGEGGDEEEERALPARLMEVVTRGGAALEAVLQDYKVGEVAPPLPIGCAVHSAALGFLLTWRVVLAMVGAAGQELRPRYSEYLRAGGHLTQLLDHLFRLLPTSPALLQETNFTPDLLPTKAADQELVAVAGSCWVAVCRHLPALARGWWQALDRPAGAGVERLTSALVTPLLWREEVAAIRGAEDQENMVLKVRDSVREVVATYSIDESSMELVVSLPANHPLGGLAVESGRRVGVDTGQWRKWMLQLTTFLTHQNGTILDGLSLWKKNVDKRFEGVEVRTCAHIESYTLFFRSATSVTTSCTAPTTSCPSWPAGPARRSSTLPVSTSGSPPPTTRPARCAGTCSSVRGL